MYTRHRHRHKLIAYQKIKSIQKKKKKKKKRVGVSSGESSRGENSSDSSNLKVGRSLLSQEKKKIIENLPPSTADFPSLVVLKAEAKREKQNGSRCQRRQAAPNTERSPFVLAISKH